MSTTQNVFSLEEMKTINNTICELYSKYQTVLDDNSFSDLTMKFIDSLREQIYFDKGNIMLYLFNEDERVYEVSSFLQVGWNKNDKDLYINTYVHIDDILPILSMNKEMAFINGNVFSNKERKKTAYYREFIEPAQITNSIDANIVLPDEFGIKALLGFFRDSGKKSFSQKDLEVIKTYQPHLSNILATHLKSSRNTLDTYYKNFCNTFESIGVCILDSNLKLDTMNSTFRRYASEVIHEKSILESTLILRLQEICQNLHSNPRLTRTGFVSVSVGQISYEVEVAYYNVTDLLGKYVCIVISDDDFFNLKLIRLKNKFNISEREYEVLALAINEGMSNEEIALNLFLSTSTVKKHFSSAYQKLNISNQKQLMPMLRNI